MIPDFDEALHRYSFNGHPYPSNTQILSGLKLTPPYPEDTGQKALGTAVHRATELAAWDSLDDNRTSPEILPYVAGFREKKQEMRIKPIFTELKLVHLGEGFAGTIDLVCEIFDGEPAIIDYKSGTPPRCVELQTAGYGELLLYYIQQTGKKPWISREKMPRRFSMQLQPNGRAIVRECKDPYDYPAFIGAVRLFKWMEERRKFA